jgi:transposase
LYAVRVEQLEILENQAENDQIDLYYGDETGISEQGYCPYGWQFKDEKVSIPVQHGKQLNCFGILNRQNQLHFKTTNQPITSQFLIDFFEQFVLTIERHTVVVLDNAKIHHSKAFKERAKYWESKGLFIVFLPPYSPHLNIIERLWRELKQRWIRPEDYVSFDNLAYAVNRALNDVGKNLNINFSKFNYIAI